jgi:hypothetical protein
MPPAGTAIFLDPSTLEPYVDQWEFLASLERLDSTVARELAETYGDVLVGPRRGLAEARPPSALCPHRR